MSDHMNQLRDLLRYYESAAAPCAHTIPNREALRWVLEEMERLLDALRGAYATVSDAVALGVVRYKADFATFSPWPELREREKAIAATLSGMPRVKPHRIEILEAALRELLISVRRWASGPLIDIACQKAEEVLR